MEQTRKLFAEWPGRVDMMPVYFHNALGQSLVDLSSARTPGPSPAINGFYTLCHQPWVNFTVDYAGRVVGCCRDLRSEYVLGNLLHEQAADIWNGERMRQLRRALAEKHPEWINVCKSCDVPWQGSYSGRTPLEKVRNFFFAEAWRR
jgi:radical SAM protein with 4Fe4S-binding SPASM domain